MYLYRVMCFALLYNYADMALPVRRGAVKHAVRCVGIQSFVNDISLKEIHKCTDGIVISLDIMSVVNN